jgi:hypothetical protein
MQYNHPSPCAEVTLHFLSKYTRMLGFPAENRILACLSVLAELRRIRRKIKLLEDNAECHHLKVLTCKVTLRQVFICLRPRTPYSPPPYTLYLYVQNIYSHREGERGGELNL